MVKMNDVFMCLVFIFIGLGMTLGVINLAYQNYLLTEGRGEVEVLLVPIVYNITSMSITNSHNTTPLYWIECEGGSGCSSVRNHNTILNDVFTSYGESAGYGLNSGSFGYDGCRNLGGLSKQDIEITFDVMRWAHKTDSTCSGISYSLGESNESKLIETYKILRWGHIETSRYELVVPDHIYNMITELNYNRLDINENGEITIYE